MVNLGFINSTINSTNLQTSFDVVAQNFMGNVFRLLIYTVAMVLYAILVWNFYRKLAKKDIFDLDFKRHHSFKVGFLKKIADFFEFIFKYIVIFPFVTFIFFAMLSILLLFLSKSQTVQQVLLTSMSIVAASRVSSYYSEDLAKDLAKMIPFALLGVFLVDPSFFSLDQVLANLKILPTLWVLILQYIIFTVIMEFILVLIDITIGSIFRAQFSDDSDNE